MPRHEFKGRKKALAELPQLHPGIKYAATYYDASVHNPERLTLDVLQDGEKAGLAGRRPRPATTPRATNYLAVDGESEGRRRRAHATSSRARRFTFTADVIVNTTGAWVDMTNTAMGAGTRFMGGTKGSHIVLDHPELLAACNGREIFFEHTDGRIVLIYPMGDRVLVGTTDVNADMTKDAVCTEEEIDYFFDLVGHVFPDVAGDPRGHRLQLRRRAPAAAPRRDGPRLRLPRLPHRTRRPHHRAAAAGSRVSAWWAASGPRSAPCPST